MGKRNQLADEQILMVYEIRKMFRVLERCFASLDDKTGIEPNLVEFHGFDGNNALESKMMRYADDINSHSPRLRIYESMLRKWNASRDKEQLTKDDIQRIIDRKTHY